MIQMVKMNKKGMLIVLIVTLVLLLVPLIAMQFTDEVNWEIMDFVLAGILLSGIGLILIFIFKRTGKSGYRIAASLAVIAVLALVWAHLAVGLFD